MTFVRHAHPVVDPLLPASSWALTAEGATAAQALTLDLTGTAVVSSPERKALQTIALATGIPLEQVPIDPAFREVDRVEAVSPGFLAARRAWVGGMLDDRHARWESPPRAVARVTAGIERRPGRHLIVGIHGMVLTAWMVAHGHIGAGNEAVDFWERMPFPAIVSLEVT